MLHIANMDEESGNPRNYLKEWRHFRNLTQMQLAELVGTSGPMINHLENGQRALNHKWLVRLAPALKTSPGFILDHNPLDMPRDLFEIWNSGNEEERAQLVKVAEAIIPFKHKPASNQ